MYHSITFELLEIPEKSTASSHEPDIPYKWNTWDDWHLVPTTRPVVAPPEPKYLFIDIPGVNGELDITDEIYGGVKYGRREGSFEFIVVNDTYAEVDVHEEWFQTYSKILSIIHGQKLKMTLEDDPFYYYKGRFSVNEWKSDSHYSTITIDYNVEPVKRYTGIHSGSEYTDNAELEIL